MLAPEAVHLIRQRVAQHPIEGGIAVAPIQGEVRVGLHHFPLRSLGIEQVLDFMAKKKLREGQHFELFPSAVAQVRFGVAGNDEGEVVENALVDSESP